MKTLIALSLITLVVSCSHKGKDKDKNETVVSTTQAEAMIDGKVKGEANFRPTAEGVVVNIKVSGLKPNAIHGVHIHQNGVCDQPGYKKAGDHFNPDAHSHGGPAASIKHIGDLGNLVANEKGVAEKEITMDGIKDVNMIMDRALIVHEKADDLVSQPSGNSGDRIACGIIKVDNT